MRLRDLGLTIGQHDVGPNNAITDVDGILVGHETVVSDNPHVVRSGVTVLVPRDGRVWTEHLHAGVHVLNGNGELTGMAWIEEFGLLTGPIALTGTQSVGAVYEGISRAALDLDIEEDLNLPIVAETDDGWLSDRAAFAVRPQHVASALHNAKGGPVKEGNVGGGTGMNAHEFKAGIGTSSRRIVTAGEPFTVGVLVQANYGTRGNLRLDGLPIGAQIPFSEVPGLWSDPRDEGSIIVIVATDAPILPHQCRRLAQRAGLGLARAGGFGAPGSGDIFLAFSTANHHNTLSQDVINTARFLSDMAMGPLISAVVEATEESIWNALCEAETMTGQLGRQSHAIPTDRVKELAQSLT